MLFKNRLNDEAVELSCKYKKLCEFLASEKFNELSRANQILLGQQKEIMAAYLDVLDVRIALLHD